MADYPFASQATEGKHYNFLQTAEDSGHLDEIARLKNELELLKNTSPFRMAEIAIELQIERLRVAEITNARDAAVQHLSESYTIIRQKNEIIERMQKEAPVSSLSMVRAQPEFIAAQKHIRLLEAHIGTLDAINGRLRVQLGRKLEDDRNAPKPIDPPPCYEVENKKATSVDVGSQTEPEEVISHVESHKSEWIEGEFKYLPPSTDDPVELVKARNTVLAGIPLPSNPPDVTLNAILIPPPFTLHEFLNGAPVSLRNALSNYRILHNITTSWCPDREEHGYFYTPVFKCNTNPRIATAHRWNGSDVIGRMSKPTECFYNREGLWYYAGSYKAFRFDDLSAKEWAQLPAQTVSAIVKETISGRKNSSPQNTYETTQLYASGALKVACVGLQCVGFNQEVYKSILEYSIRFSESKWKSMTVTENANVSTAAISTDSNTYASPANSITSTPTATPLVSHLTRIPSHYGTTNPADGSPVGHFKAARNVPSTPTALGLGLHSSAWNMAANLSPSIKSKVSPTVGISKLLKAVERSTSDGIENSGMMLPV